MKEIFSALIKAQSEMKIATKDNVNSHFRNRYADLGSVYDACKDALHRNGLAVIQPTRIHESGVTVVVTKIIHTSGQFIEGEYPVIAKDMTDPQKHGGGLTYARRYSLASMLSILQDDDDGNSASAPAAAPKPEQKKITSLADLFSAHGQQYPDCLEHIIGKRVAQWTDTEKSAARQAVELLRSGKAWDEARSVLVKAVTFS